MSLRVTALVMLVGIGIGLAGACGSEPETQRFDVVGEVVGLAPERQEVVIQHGEIVGYMGAMTMPFKVRDQTLLNGVALGDPITAVLEVSDAGAIIIEIKKTEAVP